MKRIVVLLMLLLIVPPVTALAASVTSKSFVVRNTPVEPDPFDLALSTPDLFAPASTEENGQKVLEEQGEAVEVEQVEQIEPEEQEEQDDHSEQPIPPAFTDAVETDGQPATPIFTTPVSTDEVEMDEGEFVGEVEGQDGPVDDHSGEIEEASSESAEKPAESEQCEEIEPEGEEQPIP